jgi:hypothetical protein
MAADGEGNGAQEEAPPYGEVHHRPASIGVAGPNAAESMALDSTDSPEPSSSHLPQNDGVRERHDLIWNIVGDRPMPTFPDLPSTAGEDSALPSADDIISRAILRDGVAEPVSRFFPSVTAAPSTEAREDLLAQLGDARRAVEAALTDLGGPPATSSSSLSTVAVPVSSARFSTTVLGRPSRSLSRPRAASSEDDPVPVRWETLNSHISAHTNDVITRPIPPVNVPAHALSPTAPVFHPVSSTGPTFHSLYPAAHPFRPFSDEALFAEARRAVRDADELSERTSRAREDILGEGMPVSPRRTRGGR